MPGRKIDIAGTTWRVSPSGYITSYEQDEFGLIFSRDSDGRKEMRITRYSPQGSRSREQSFRELTDDQLRELFAQSQPSFTSPEVGYTP